ncbi:MAG: class I SAM-dependent methyltransferase [Nitrospina sp.]|jgi:SAM-dependent methyltransferase|nr:class I SAM-dependent methyltransferase [Nitrospina sp.]MBT6717662.1 class I SAM-dependent methyltransferase [Nitrospina sp.]
MNCRHCGLLLDHVFLDLGVAPPSNAYLKEADLQKPETRLPLKLFVCDNCWLVQTEDFARPTDLFDSDYAYFSSTSQTWLEHASRYSEMMCDRFELGSSSHVIEVASNDGYLLKNFLAKGIPCLGIEPTASTAAAAEALGIPVVKNFFGQELAVQLADENKKADLIAGNNVYAHVPDINDFTKGLKVLLKPDGVITLEFPHLLKLIGGNQFDTVYHEHFSYLSLHTVCKIFEQAGLKVWDVEHLPTHGGSLRIFGCHAENSKAIAEEVGKSLLEEKNCGLQQISTYQMFQGRVEKVKADLLIYLAEQKNAGKVVAAYGAAAKGNTLLNFSGIKDDLIAFVCDAAPSKQGKYLPGSHIPIFPPNKLREQKPDIVLILPWNIAEEVISQNEYVYDWGGKFITAVPEIRLVR